MSEDAINGHECKFVPMCSPCGRPMNAAGEPPVCHGCGDCYEGDPMCLECGAEPLDTEAKVC